MLFGPEPQKQRVPRAVCWGVLAAAVSVPILVLVAYRNARQDAFDQGMDAYQNMAWCRAARHFDNLFALSGAESLRARARAAYDESQFMCQLEAAGGAYPGEEPARMMRFLSKNPHSRFRALAHKKWLDALDVAKHRPASLAELERPLRRLAACGRLADAPQAGLPLEGTDEDRQFYAGVLALRGEDPELFHSTTSRAQELYRKGVQWLSADKGPIGQEALAEVASAACDQRPSPGWLAPALASTGQGKLAFNWERSRIDWHLYNHPGFGRVQAWSPGEVRWVACAEARDITLEVCHYATCVCDWRRSEKCQVHRMVKMVDVSLHDPMSGRLVARRQFKGLPPRKCKEEESFQRLSALACTSETVIETLDGGELPWESVAEWSSQFPATSTANSPFPNGRTPPRRADRVQPLAAAARSGAETGPGR